MRVRVQALGADHPQCARVLHSLVDCLVTTRQTPEALASLKRLCETYASNYGGDGYPGARLLPVSLRARRGFPKTFFVLVYCAEKRCYLERLLIHGCTVLHAAFSWQANGTALLCGSPKSFELAAARLKRTEPVITASRVDPFEQELEIGRSGSLLLPQWQGGTMHGATTIC